MTIVCTQQDGEPTGELQTGSYYGLEMLQDGEWIAVDLLPMEHELAWTSEAWMIPNNAETEWEVNWSRLYGELPAGSYRISKSVMDFRGTGDYDTKTYYAALISWTPLTQVMFPTNTADLASVCRFFLVGNTRLRNTVPMA